MTAETQAVHLFKTVHAFLRNEKLPEYKPSEKPVFAVTLGRSRASGQMGNFKLFSIMIWWLKGRFMGTNAAPDWAAGKKSMSAKFE